MQRGDISEEKKTHLESDLSVVISNLVSKDKQVIIRVDDSSDQSFLLENSSKT